MLPDQLQGMVWRANSLAPPDLVLLFQQVNPCGIQLITA